MNCWKDGAKRTSQCARAIYTQEECHCRRSWIMRLSAAQRLCVPHTEFIVIFSPFILLLRSIFFVVSFIHPFHHLCASSIFPFDEVRSQTHTQLSLRFYTRKGKKKKYANKEVPLKSIKQQQLFTAQRLRWGLTQQYTQHVLTHFADGIEDCSWRMSKNGQSFQLKGRRGRWKR